MAVAAHAEVALPKNVHADEGIQLKAVGKFEAADVVEYEGEGRAVRLRFQTNSEQVALGLALALRRAERPLSALL